MKTKEKTRIEKIGVVGVDSGNLIITDPCYIDSEWEKEDFKDVRVYQHKETGEKLQYGIDFPDYEAVIEKYGKTMNELNRTGECRRIEAPKAKHPFSYNAVCRANDTGSHGQLYYKRGHAGVGVVSSTGYGDGVYPVYAEILEDTEFGDRVKRIWVEFIND